MSLPESWHFKTTLPGITWPAIPDPQSATELAILLQLEQVQHLSPDALAQRQQEQLKQIVHHAHASVPFYRRRWQGLFDPSAPFSMASLARLPRMTRQEVQQNFGDLQSRAIPASHGQLIETSSSGSTGMPVRVIKTMLCALYWNAFTLRDHWWHQRDLRLPLCAIRSGASGDADNWGRATAMLHTGPAHGCDVTVDISTQLDWLVQRNPGYLLTYPSIVRELISLSQNKGVKLPRLREVRTIGEPLTDELRDACQAAWGVPVRDTYSSEEIGYIALRCPEGDRYHCQSESVLVEVLHDDGRPCAPGEQGRVVVTTLLNFAMPLIRYELGDYAEVGQPCPCGRCSPVLNRIMGRIRNTLKTASGQRYWPTFKFLDDSTIAPVSQWQVVQTALDRVQMRYVAATPLSSDQKAVLEEQVRRRLPAGFAVETLRVDAIGRSKGGKFEDFISELSTH